MLAKLDDLIAEGAGKWRPSDDDMVRITAARNLTPPLMWRVILNALNDEHPGKQGPSESTLRMAWQYWKNCQD